MATEDIVESLSGIVHEPTQVGDRGVDLTAAEVYELAGPGRMDFGGGELEPADLDPHAKRYRNPDDDYRWWDLDGGTYLIEFNESLDGGPFRLQPRVAVVERGGSHPSLSVTSLPRVPLTVAGEGLRIKANARVSTLLPE